MRSIDVAIALLTKSIERGKEDKRYYMDYVKLHKLIFLGQCFHRYVWDMDLVDDSILISDSGFYINGLNAVVAYCGFGEIKDVEELKNKQGFYLPMTLLRDETCDFILDNFGTLTTMELVKLTKRLDIYQRMIGCNNNVISSDAIYKTGTDIFEKDDESILLKVKVKKTYNF